MKISWHRKCQASKELRFEPQHIAAAHTYHIKKMCCSLLLIPLFMWGKRSESINALSSYSPLRNAASLLQKSLRAEEMHYVFFFFPLPDVKSSLLLLRTAPRIVALCDAFKGAQSLPESLVLSHFNSDLIITISVIAALASTLSRWLDCGVGEETAGEPHCYWTHKVPI